MKKIYKLFLLSFIIIIAIGCKNEHTHTHEFIEGKCECGEIEEHIHSFEDGLCKCGESEVLGLTLSWYETYYAVTYCSIGKEISCVKIPEKYNNLPVSCISQYAFSNNSYLRNIEIPKSIDRIGEGAFNFCESLESIVIPENVKCIETKTFYKCTNLQNVIIPNGVTKIEREAFYGCENLESIVIPKSVIEIEEYAFYGCHNLKIYCESESMPAGWSEEWEHGNEVIWDYVK